MPWRWKKRDRAELDAAMPRSARRARNSSRLWSRASSNAAMTSVCRASIRRDRMSPPRGFGSKLPIARCCASQRITDDTDTPKRPAAARRLIPASTAANARFLKSIGNALPISLPRYLPPEQRVRNEPPWESPYRCKAKGRRSNARERAFGDDPNGPARGTRSHDGTIIPEAIDTLEWVDWFNHRRLLEPIGNISPAEAEANHHAKLETRAMAA